MPVDLLISPPATGKTADCIRRIHALLDERPFSPVQVVLPDRLQATAFRRRLAEAGGALGVQVGTFGDLYRKILEACGCPVPLASPAVVHRLVLTAVQNTHNSGMLQHYAGLRDTPGFILTLRDTFAELKRALVYPERFLEQSVSGSPAQQELARLYLEYQTQLQTLGWADPEGLSWLAVEALETLPDHDFTLSLLVIDGFDSFTGSQQRAMELLEPRIAEMLVTLPGKYPFQRAAHRRFQSAFQALASVLPISRNRTLPTCFLPASLQHIEANLFETASGQIEAGENLYLVEARSPSEEAREALRWLKARVVRDGISLQACAVVVPDVGVYRPHLRQASAEFGLPLRFTQGDALAQSPAITALLALLSAPALNFPRRLLIDAIRSPYFDLSNVGLDLRSADILDITSIYGQVIEGREQWDEVLDQLSNSTEDIEIEIDSETDLQSPHLPRGAQANLLKQQLDRFIDRITPPIGERSLREWITWLEDLLDEWHYYEQGTEERDQAAYEQFRQTLRALVLGEAVTGPQVGPYKQFFTELQGALNGIGILTSPPARQPAVMVVGMLDARGIRFEAVAILGLSEGIFPAVERADPFLDETLRHDLGIEPQLQREQAGLFYQAITRSDRFLLLTRPYLADDGEKWEPSPYWKAVLTLLAEGSVQTIRPDDPRPLTEAASPEEALFWAVRQRSLPRSFADLLPRWAYLRHAHTVLKTRMAEQAEGRYEGHVVELADLLAERYGTGHVWSASRFETYCTCPHQFYVKNVLELEVKSPPETGMDAAQLGTTLHLILERAYRLAEDPANPDTVLAVLPGIARQVFDRAPQERGFRPSPLWQILQQQYLLVLKTTVQRLAELDDDAGWQPVAFEKPFGLGGAPVLEVTIDRQKILLHGVVDRVDRDAAGNIRVIDYKTGASHLDKSDLIQGRRLQLPLYALAASDALDLGKVAEGLYWALLKGEAGSLKLSTFKSGDDSGPQAAITIALAHLGQAAAGIRQGDFLPAPPQGGCPAYCPASSWCWRYTPGWGA